MVAEKSKQNIQKSEGSRIQDVRQLHTQEISAARRALVEGAKTIPELNANIKRLGQVKGSTQTFSAEYLDTAIRALDDFYKGRKVDLKKESAQYVMATNTITGISQRGGDVFTVLTNTYGIRQKAKELITSESQPSQKSGNKAKELINRLSLKYDVRRAKIWESNASIHPEVIERMAREDPKKFKAMPGRYESLSKAAEAAKALGQIEMYKDQLKLALEHYEESIKSRPFDDVQKDVQKAMHIAKELGEEKSFADRLAEYRSR